MRRTIILCAIAAGAVRQHGHAARGSEVCRGTRIEPQLLPEQIGVLSSHTMCGVSTTPVAADLILMNANVLTIDPSCPRAQAVAIGDGRVLAVGSNDEVRNWVNPGVAVRDLAGQTLLPGFYDSHNHMLLTGLNLAAVSSIRGQIGRGCRPRDGRASRQRAAGPVGAELGPVARESARGG